MLWWILGWFVLAMLAALAVGRILWFCSLSDAIGVAACDAEDVSSRAIYRRHLDDYWSEHGIGRKA